jgi:hypothetical protein
VKLFRKCYVTRKEEKFKSVQVDGSEQVFSIHLTDEVNTNDITDITISKNKRTITIKTKDNG